MTSEVETSYVEEYGEIDYRAEQSYTQELIDASVEIQTIVPGLQFIEVLKPALPVTATFELDGQRWYFRARYENVSFHLLPPADEYDQQKYDPANIYRFTITTENYYAGALPGKDCVIAFAVFCGMIKRLSAQDSNLEHTG